MRRKILVPIVAVLGIIAGGCFTGVESTPRIRADKDMRAEADRVLTAEETLLDVVRPTPPAQWRRGKAFVVSDSRIGRIFTPAEDENLHRRGTEMNFVRTDTAASLTGDTVIAVVLSDELGQHIYRLPAADSKRFGELESLSIPFTIDKDMVSDADSLLRGRRLYVRTPLWYSTSGDLAQIRGLRHVEVHVDSVVPGTDQFPAAVCFTAKDTGKSGMILINLTCDRAGSRPFSAMFALDNPRRQYPEIKDDIWTLITQSRVRDGMSRDECRLALGQPDQIIRTPTYGGMREHWRYTDGTYLVFDDGFLTSYRL